MMVGFQTVLLLHLFEPTHQQPRRCSCELVPSFTLIRAAEVTSQMKQQLCVIVFINCSCRSRTGEVAMK